MKNILSIFIVFFFFVTGCAEKLPKDLKKQAKAVPNRIEEAKVFVERNKDKYMKLTEKREFILIKTIALKENWQENFKLADNHINNANKVYALLKPLIKKNRAQNSLKVHELINKVDKNIQMSTALCLSIFERFVKISSAIKNIDSLAPKANQSTKKIIAIVDETKKNSRDKAIKDFNDSTKKIEALFGPLQKLADKSHYSLQIVTKEHKKHKDKTNPDYAAFADHALGILSNLELIKQYKEDFTKRIEELYQSYTKILFDMKIEYFVTIQRESWNERSDFYNPESINFYRKISQKAYEVVTKDNIDSIATIKSGFTGTKFLNYIPKSVWEELSINPIEKWPRNKGHNSASFFVQSTELKYFHKYLIEKNSEKQETNYQEVDQSFYEANLEYLGMAILVKPYGVFEKDRQTKASPPGMAYVGNSKYGEWKKDDTGNRFWSWYGRYAFFSSLFFFPPSYYYYNSWYGWNNHYRNRKPYFGTNAKGTRKYGTSGSYTKRSPRFQSSAFVKSGGLKTQSASMKRSSAKFRGRGPKKRGK